MARSKRMFKRKERDVVVCEENVSLRAPLLAKFHQFQIAYKVKGNVVRVTDRDWRKRLLAGILVKRWKEWKEMEHE